MRFSQLLLDVHEELIVDLFAGGGGASLGIEMATGRNVDVAVNHDAAAVAMHRVNHPQTDHHVCDVFEVDPRVVTSGRPIGLLWASPDCTYHSKARGGKPFRDSAKKRRALAWVVTRWAGQVRPRVIMLENVEEFAQWGPLCGRLGRERPDPRKRGRTFRRWVRILQRLGYQVEWRELRAAAYGAPTTRKRLFVVARCDGKPIVWPKPTHGPGTFKPYRAAAECIDWSIPMLSIFATKKEARAWAQHLKVPTPRRPLASATLRRVARGVERFVLDHPKPFIVPLTHGRDAFRGQALGDPLPTITGAQRGEQALVAPFLVPRYGERPGQDPRTLSIQEPHPVVVPTANGASLCAAFLARHWGGMVGKDLRQPHPTVLTKGAQDQVAAVSLTKLRGTSSDADPAEPLHTVSAQGNHHAVVASFLQKYYGQGIGSRLTEPVPTLTTKDRMGLVTVSLEGEDYILADIGMRMLAPRELYRAQGFPDTYHIERGVDGRRFTKTEQVRMVGNSVSPQVAAALVAANAPELRARDEAVA